MSSNSSKYIFDAAYSSVSGGAGKFAKDSHLIKELTNKKGKNMLMAAVADDQCPFRDGQFPADLAFKMLIDFFGSPAMNSIKSGSELAALEDSVRDLFNNINSALYQKALQEGSQVSLSLSVAVAVDDSIFVGHVGLGKVFTIQRNEVLPLTQEQSWYTRAMKMRGMSIGAVPPAEHSFQIESLGMDQSVECAFQMVNLSPDDKVVLCTDGISEFISDQEMQVIINSIPNLPGACNRLGDIAQERGLKDHATVIVFNARQKADAEKRSLNEITDKKEKNQRNCGSLFFYIVVFLLIIIGVGMFIGLKYAQKLMKSITEPSGPAQSIVKPEAMEAPALTSGKFYFVIEDDSVPLEIIRFNKNPLNQEEKIFEILDEHNELELFPQLDKAHYSVILTTNYKDKYHIYEGSTRNRIRVFKDNIIVNLTPGSFASAEPQAEGGVAKIAVAGLGSPVFIVFGKENMKISVIKENGEQEAGIEEEQE